MVGVYVPTECSERMNRSDQEKADQSTLEEEETHYRGEGDEAELASEDVANDSTSMSDGANPGGNSQRTIRDMLDEEGGASVFANRDLVEPDTIIDEERIVGRDEQLKSVVSFLKPTLHGNRPPNMLLYGPAGTGKSLIIGAVTQQIIDLCKSKGERFGVIAINCQPINTLDQAVYELVQTAAKDMSAEIGVPETGVSTKRKYRRLYELVNQSYDSVIFILDEIDLLIGRRTNEEPAYSKLLYQLSRASNTNEIEGRVSVAALTNDPKFMENIDGRAESSFNPRDVYFPDYDAYQLREILKNRRDAFQPGALEEDVIPLVAAFAAQSHPDRWTLTAATAWCRLGTSFGVKNTPDLAYRCLEVLNKALNTYSNGLGGIGAPASSAATASAPSLISGCPPTLGSIRVMRASNSLSAVSPSFDSPSARSGTAP